MKHCFIGVSVLSLCSLFPISAYSKPIYCAHGAGYVQIGMTENQVLAVCGPPTSKRESTGAPTHKVPVTQLIYTSVVSTNPYPGYQAASYDAWSIPSGLPAMFSYQVDVVKNQVTAVQMNGEGGNATNICGGTGIQVGDDISQVYSQCGRPSATNTTYIDEPIPASGPADIWIYQFQYQPAFSLTFVNGRLESID